MKRGLVLVLFLLVLCATVGAVTTISTCSTTGAGGMYVLNSDLGPVTGSCIIVGASNTEIDCQGHSITFGTGTGTYIYGIGAVTKTNVTIRNCVILDANAGGDSNYGILFDTVTGGLIDNNTVSVFGALTPIGIYSLISPAAGVNLEVSNNRVTVRGQSSARGISFNAAGNSTAVNNVVYVNSTGGTTNAGIHASGQGNMTIRNNTLFLNGASTNNFGVYQFTCSEHVVQDNVIVLDGATTGSVRGSTMSAGCNDSVVAGNNITILSGGGVSGSMGVAVYSSDRTNVRDNVVRLETANIERGIVIGTSSDCTVTNNTVTVLGDNDRSSGIQVAGTTANTYLASNAIFSLFSWIEITSTTTNTTVANQALTSTFGGVVFGNFSGGSGIMLNASLVNLTNASIFVNTTAVPELNTSARITFSGTGFMGHKILIDYDDAGVFEDCPADVCTEVSDVPGEVVFDVTHFTSFSAADFTPKVPEFSTIALIGILVVGLSGLVVMRGR